MAKLYKLHTSKVRNGKYTESLIGQVEGDIKKARALALKHCSAHSPRRTCSVDELKDGWWVMIGDVWIMPGRDGECLWTTPNGTWVLNKDGSLGKKKRA